MRILQVDSGAEMRGGQRQALLLMCGLRERAHESLLLARPQSPLWQAAETAGFTLARATLGNLRHFSRDCDLVHVHDARAHTLAVLASKRPVVVSRRVAFPVKRGLLSRWKYARPRRYLAVSRFVAAQLVRAGVPEQKIDIVYDGIEPSAVPPRAAEPFLVAALATRDLAKGRTLVEEASRLAQLPVRFSSDLERDLHESSLFVYATQSEGLGSAALFAMSLEVAVIASRVGGLPEIVEDGISGLLVENTAPAFAAAIERLQRDRQLCARLARNGRLRVEREFTSCRMIEATLAAYEHALA